MKVNLILILLTILLIKIKNKNPECVLDIENNILKIKEINNKNISIILSTYISESIVNNSIIKSSAKENIINRVFYKGEESSQALCTTIYYFYFIYGEICKNEEKDYEIETIFNFDYENGTNFNDIKFYKIYFTKTLLSYDIHYILSLNNLEFSLIILDYYKKNFHIDNFTDEEQEDKNIKNYTYLIDDKNICFEKNKYDNLLDTIKNKKFICKLDYILFGHEDLKKNDVYLAKEIDEDYSFAIIDNLLSYSIFPEEYFEYFFTSFFSELNDGCQKNEFKFDDYDNSFYYITCPKKKIEIYTKRRTLNIIINKFAYRIKDLFKDSLEFLEKIENDDRYYFNIVFEKDRKNFILGIGFMMGKAIGIYNNRTYIYSEDRIDYTEDLTDINSDQFEKWLYILTTFSFTFLLLIFTILGCIHSRKVNKELKEMLK
jgi:hypothetical protein